MVHGIHHIELDMPVERIWGFVSDMNNWAPLVPGYLEHVIINDRQSVWKIHGDIGIMQRTVNLNVTITEWTEPTNVNFQLIGLKETCVGKGYFKAESLLNGKSEMTGFLDISIKGMMGPMVNPVLKSLVPKVGREFTEAVAAKMVRSQAVMK